MIFPVLVIVTSDPAFGVFPTGPLAALSSAVGVDAELALLGGADTVETTHFAISGARFWINGPGGNGGGPPESVCA